MPLSFSIIICTRNSLPLLEETVGSVLMQEGVEAEIIFVDGGSTDGTLEWIEKLRRPYRLLENQRGGLTRAMNAGLHAASGDVLAFLRPDACYLSPDTLSVVSRQLEACRLGWLFGNAMQEIGGKPAQAIRAPRYSYERLLQNNFIAESAAFVRRDLMQRIGGFDPHLRHARSYDLWLKLGCLSHPYQLDGCIAVQREYEGSHFARKRLARMDEELRVRLAHAGDGRMTRSLFRASHLVRRRRALHLGSGEEHASARNVPGLAQNWRKYMRHWLTG